MEEKKHTELSSLDKIILNPPTERYLLYIISKDPTAFTAPFLLEVAMNQRSVKPDPNSNLSKALVMQLNLHEKKYVKTLIKNERVINKVTWRGQYYRLYTHPSLVLWGIVVAILFGIPTFNFISTCNKGNSITTPTTHTILETAYKKQQPIVYELHPKSKPDTISKSVLADTVKKK